MSWSLSSGPWTGSPQQELGRLAAWKLSAKHKDPSTVSFDIDGFTPEASAIRELVDDLWLRVGDQTVYRGRITQSSDDFSGDGHSVSFSSVDYRGVLGRRMIWDNWTLVRTTIDPAEDAWQLVAKAQTEPGGDLGIVRGETPSPVTVAEIKHEAGAFVAPEIDADSKLDPGFDWDVTPVGDTGKRFDVWRPGRGQVRDLSLELGPSGTPTRDVDPSVYGNAIRLPGGTDSANNPLPAVRREATDIATRPEGRWDLAVQDSSNVSTAAAGAARADYELAHDQVLQPAYSFNLAPGVWRTPDDFWIGDTVTLWLRSGRLLIDEQLSVEALDVTSNPDADEPTVTVTLGAYTAEQQQRLRLRAIDRRLGTLLRR